MAKKRGGIKAVAFDVGGVLQLAKKSDSHKKLHANIGVHQKLARKFKLSIDNYFDFIDSDYVLSIEGKIKKEKLISDFSKRFKVSGKKIESFYKKAYKNEFRKNKFLLRYAKKLKKRGVKVAILSDQWQLSISALIPKKFYGIFDLVVVSCNEGVRKPNSRIYKILLRKLKLNPQEVLFVDNRDWNLSPAKKLGMRALLFRGNKDFKKRIKELNIVNEQRRISKKA